ncbi:hypothetical protein VPHK354_0212 [Vibrio phage K354]
MKQAVFEKMVGNPPEGATHYKRFRDYVIFFTNIDDIFGSHDSMCWFADEDFADEVWFTRRERVNMNKVVKL